MNCIHRWLIGNNGKAYCPLCKQTKQFDQSEPVSCAIGWKDYAALEDIRLAELQVWNNNRANFQLVRRMR